MIIKRFLAFIVVFMTLIALFSPSILGGVNNIVFAQAGDVPGSGTNPPPETPGSGSNPPPSGSGVAPINIKIDNPIKYGTIYTFLEAVINNIVLPIGGIIAVLYIMYAGFLLVTARGDEGQIKLGKAAFLHAAIGTAILLGAWVIAKVIGTTICSLTSNNCP